MTNGHLFQSESSTENLTKDGKETVDRILHQKVHFKLFYVGSVVEISGLNSTRRDTEAQLVDYIEEKQVNVWLKKVFLKQNFRSVISVKHAVLWFSKCMR